MITNIFNKLGSCNGIVSENTSVQNYGYHTSLALPSFPQPPRRAPQTRQNPTPPHPGRSPHWSQPERSAELELSHVHSTPDALRRLPTAFRIQPGVQSPLKPCPWSRGVPLPLRSPRLARPSLVPVSSPPGALSSPHPSRLRLAAVSSGKRPPPTPLPSQVCLPLLRASSLSVRPSL